MCCCDKPTVNGQPGYKWQPDHAPFTRQPDPPPIDEADTLLYDEPGRCGGVDSHSHHYRVVKRGCGWLVILVRHGGGDDFVRTSSVRSTLEASLAALDSTARYWVLNAIYSAYSHGKTEGRDNEAATWRKAAAEGRIKTRKQRGKNTVKVSIESAPLF